MRVNARLDEATSQQLEYLTQATGQSVSQVLRESVAQYYVQLKRQQAPSGFLAMAGKGRSGLGDLSVHAKAYFAQAMEQKYPLPLVSAGEGLAGETAIKPKKPRR